MSLFDIISVLIGFLFIVGIIAGFILFAFVLLKKKLTVWGILSYSVSVTFFILALLDFFFRFWEGFLLVILGFIFLPQVHEWVKNKFKLKYAWAIISVLVLLVMCIFIPVTSNYNKHYAEIKAEEISRLALKQKYEEEEKLKKLEEEKKEKGGYDGLITHGEFFAAISEAYLDEATMYIVDGDEKALDKLIKAKAVFYLKPNIEVYLVQESSRKYDKVEFRINEDKRTAWTRKDAIGESFSKEISKQLFKEKWPFTIEKGTLRCIIIKVSHLTIHSIIFNAGGKSYAINGTAKNWAKRNGYSNSNEIWNQNVPIGQIIEDGLKLCE